MIFKVTEIKEYGAMGGYTESIVCANDQEHARVLAAKYFNELWGMELTLENFEAEALPEGRGVLYFEVKDGD